MAVAWVTLLSIFLTGAARTFDLNLIDRGSDFSLSAAYSYITIGLSLLLVFKTNSSYSRWWEARKIWGRVFDLNRHLARLVRSSQIQRWCSTRQPP